MLNNKIKMEGQTTNAKVTLKKTTYESTCKVERPSQAYHIAMYDKESITDTLHQSITTTKKH